MRFLMMSTLFLTIQISNLCGQASPCLPAGTDSAYMVQRVRDVIRNTSAVGKTDSVYLPVVPDTAVAIVSDTAVCRAAATAYSAQTPPGDTASAATAVYVVRVGTARYVVWDGHQYLGEWAWFRVFDQGFIHKGDFGG